MIITIPTESDTPNWDQTTPLEGSDYGLRFRYNARENRYYLSISDSQGVDLLNGVKLLCNLPLLLGYVDSRLPAGALVCVSRSPNDTLPPGLNELGSRVVLCYITSDDPSLAA